MHMNSAMPVSRLLETNHLVAFHHPRPLYQVHILIMPKKQVGSLMDLEPDDVAFLAELLSAVQQLVSDLGLLENGYRLIVNGGRYQAFPRLHFHLVSGEL